MNSLRAQSTNSKKSPPLQSENLVWDLPVRLFHWLMVFSFAGAYLSAEAENWRTVHITLGFTMAALVGFRICWGFFGSHYARFSNFVRGPRVTLRYLRSVLQGRPQHFTGHNPAGAVAIILMLLVTIALSGSGWLLYAATTGEWMEEVHEFIAGLMLPLVLVHIAGVLVSSYLHRENLVKAMITGKKNTGPDAAPSRLSTGTALVLLLAILAFWWWQGGHPDAPGASLSSTSAHHHKSGEDDD